MPSLAPGKCCCTAWASTCAQEWRMTPCPSGTTACDSFDLSIPVRHPVEVTQQSLRVSSDHHGVWSAGWRSPFA